MRIKWSFDKGQGTILAGRTFTAKVIIIDELEKYYGVYAEYGQDYIPFDEATIVKRKKLRLPRKIKKQIPQGPYCYKNLGQVVTDTEWYIKTKPCLFYKNVRMKNLPIQNEISKEFPESLVGYCGLLKDALSVDDEIKDCGINCKYRRK